MTADKPDLTKALEEIARQKLPREMTFDVAESTDFRGAYIEIVNLARAALKIAKESGNG